MSIFNDSFNFNDSFKNAVNVGGIKFNASFGDYADPNIVHFESKYGEVAFNLDLKTMKGIFWVDEVTSRFPNEAIKILPVKLRKRKDKGEESWQCDTLEWLGAQFPRFLKKNFPKAKFKRGIL